MRRDYSAAIPQEWTDVSKVFECLGHEQRQRILLTFEKGEELSAKDIVEVSAIGRTAVVFHLKKMEEAGILSSRKQGKFALYKIEPEAMRAALTRTVAYIQTQFGDKAP